MSRRCLTFIACCCFFAVQLFGQVEGLRLPVTLRDTAAIRIYIKTTDSLTNKNADSAARRYLYAANLAKSVNYSDAVVYCLLNVGDYYFNYKKNYHHCLTILNDALPYVNKIQSPDRYHLIPKVYNLLGGSFHYIGNLDSAIHYYLLAIQVIDSLELKEDQLYLTIHGNLGSSLAASRQYTQGTMYLKKVVHLLKQKGGKDRLDRGDSMTFATVYGNLGALYGNFLNKPDSAQWWWRQSATLYGLLHEKAKLQSTYANMGSSWLIDVQLDIVKAKAYLDSAVNLDSVEAKNDLQIQIALGRLNYHSGQYQPAIKYSLRAVYLCDEAGTYRQKMIPYETLFLCNVALGNYKESQKYRLKWRVVSDSILNERVNFSISKAETRYRVAEKDKILAEKQAALYQQRYWLAGSIGGGGILLLVLVGFVRNSRQRRRLERERIQNLERQKKIDQLQVERETEERERKRIAQELHDGLGVLLSAAKINQTMLARVVPGAESAKPFNESKLILSQMQQEVEWITNNLVPDYITENGLESALHTLAAKFNRPGVFDIHLESYGAVKELHPDRAFSLYRALEEILHNAVKHSGGNRLDIQLMYHPDQLHISLEDNGKGFDTQVTYAGMGMQNIRNRIMGMGGIFELSSIPGKGTSYILQVPY